MDYNIEKMKQQIAESEKELQVLKRKVAELKGEDNSAFEPKNILLEELDIDSHFEGILENKHIFSLEQILKMSDDEVDSLEKENQYYAFSKLRSNWSSGNREEIIEYAKKIRFATNFLEKQKDKLQMAVKIYKRFRRFGINEALVFANLKGNLDIIYRYWKMPFYMYSKDLKIYLYNAYKSCERGEFPALKAFFDAKECTFELVKAVILEDVTETMKWVDKNSGEYVNLSNIYEAIKEYE